MHRLPFRRTCRFSDFIWICLLWITGANADDHWQRFRGLGGRGIGSATADLPLEWNQDKNVAWVSDVPGWGWSSPIVQGNQVFITTVVNDEKINTPAKGLYLGQGVENLPRVCTTGWSSASIWTPAKNNGDEKLTRGYRVFLVILKALMQRRPQ